VQQHVADCWLPAKLWALYRSCRPMHMTAGRVWDASCQGGILTASLALPSLRLQLRIHSTAVGTDTWLRALRPVPHLQGSSTQR
jgi:hypothetical protein